VLIFYVVDLVYLHSREFCDFRLIALVQLIAWKGLTV